MSTSFVRACAFLLMSASLVACYRTDTADRGSTADTDVARKTAQPAAPGVPGGTLTMAKTRGYVQALKNLRAGGVTDIAIKPDETMEQYVARLASVPKVSKPIEDAGLSLRDFAEVNNVLIAAVLAQSMADAGQVGTPPDGISAADMQFVQQNKAEIEALLASAQGEG